MLKNYFKIAIAVLKRRKFFTFISLFGISFTLTILIVLTSFYDFMTDAGYPDTKRSRSLYVQRMALEFPKTGGGRSGPVSNHFMETFVSKLKLPEKVAMGSIFYSTNTYINNKKLVINMKYTNDQFWEVFDFQFLEGKPYGAREINNREKAVVITARIKQRYFGDVSSVVGKYITTDNEQFRVSGVVKDVPITDLFSYGEFFVPYTLLKSGLNDKGYNGRFLLTLLAPDASKVPAMQKEYAELIRKLPPPEPDVIIQSNADYYIESYTRQFFRDKNGGSGYRTFMLFIYSFLFFFMLLPTLNLVNINMSRIMERGSEIGVRKAFGASSGTLAIQFIIENLILTVIGGLIGIVLSLIVIAIFNNSGAIPFANLTINLKVLFISLLLCLTFGLLSGVYPAWRMSRLQVIRALKAV